MDILRLEMRGGIWDVDTVVDTKFVTCASAGSGLSSLKPAILQRCHCKAATGEEFD
jgi:hypothetical protein